MDMSEPGNDTSVAKRSKVARLIEEYELEGIGAEMENRWTAEDSTDRWSLRDLADDFNHRLLEEELSAAGVRALDGESGNFYRLLTDDDVSEADRTRARRRLERKGVDIEGLLNRFVTYQAVRTYLREYRGAEYSRSDGDRLETERTNIQRLQGRTESVTQEKLEQLERGDHIELGTIRTIVETTVVCEDCGGRYEVSALLNRRGCDCRTHP